MTRNFPFSIRQVAKILNLKIRYDNNDSGNMDIDCPFCQKKSKMNLNASKNVYRCNHCGEYGGMVQLYGKIHGISNVDAYREICEILGCDRVRPNGVRPGWERSNDVNYGDVGPAYYSKTAINQDAVREQVGCQAQNAVQKQDPGQEPVCRRSVLHRADNNTVHQTYSMLLSMLTLATPHKEQLLARGLSRGHVEKFNYKSVPAFGQQGLCEKLLQSGSVLEGVPGFYKEIDENGVWNGKWSVKLKTPGIIIPVYGIDGKIAGIQIRLNKPINNRKYIWLSSIGLDGGASPGAPIHFIGDPAAKRVYVTDGALKGTIAHNLTGHTFICLPGANSLKGLDDLLLCLKANGTVEAVEAFNISKLANEQAKESANKLREKLYAHGFKVTSAVWNDKALNGVDDYFLNRAKEKKKLSFTGGTYEDKMPA